MRTSSVFFRKAGEEGAVNWLLIPMKSDRDRHPQLLRPVRVLFHPEKQKCLR